MNKIEQGIKLNQEHINKRLAGIEEEISFADLIINLGFKDLNDFFEQKRIYEMQQFLKGKVSLTTPLGGLQAILNKEYGIISAISDTSFIYKGNNEKKQINVEYCQLHNIPIYNYSTFGGAIVVSPGDYSIGVILPLIIDLDSNLFLNNIATILKKYFLNVRVDNNDILINNKKVLGSAVFSDKDFFFFVAQISFSDKIELIKEVCGDINSNEKQPGFIDPNILSAESLLEELLAWLQGL